MESEEDSTDVIVKKQPTYLREEFHKPEESTVNLLEDEPLMIHSSSSLVTDGKSLTLLIIINIISSWLHN